MKQSRLFGPSSTLGAGMSFELDLCYLLGNLYGSVLFEFLSFAL